MTTELTAAEQYARLKADQFEAFLDASFTDEALKNVELFEVKAASGMVFKCRRPDAAFAANSGQMPVGLSETLIMAEDAGLKDLTPEERDKVMQDRFRAMPIEEKRANMAATAKLVRYICVEPRLIVGDVGTRRNAISTDDLTIGDFQSLAAWANDGGGAASGPKTFRTRRKRK